MRMSRSARLLVGGTRRSSRNRKTSPRWASSRSSRQAAGDRLGRRRGHRRPGRTRSQTTRPARRPSPAPAARRPPPARGADAPRTAHGWPARSASTATSRHAPHPTKPRQDPAASIAATRAWGAPQTSSAARWTPSGPSAAAPRPWRRSHRNGRPRPPPAARGPARRTRPAPARPGAGAHQACQPSSPRPARPEEPRRQSLEAGSGLGVELGQDTNARQHPQLRIIRVGLARRLVMAPTVRRERAGRRRCR